MSRKTKNFRAFMHQNPNPTIEQTWSAAWDSQQGKAYSTAMEDLKLENRKLEQRLEGQLADLRKAAQAVVDHTEFDQDCSVVDTRDIRGLKNALEALNDE